MTKKHSKATKKRLRSLSIVIGSVFLLLVSSFGAFHYVLAKTAVEINPVTFINPNFGVKNKVIEFFEANDASAMIPIIKCESHFRHYDKSGKPLQNSSGSSAVGVAQILSSMHPDQKIIDRYNKRFNAGLSIEDLDVTTFEGNIGYALVLYKMNGTRDWECSKKI